jgi:hypothetical protein
LAELLEKVGKFEDRAYLEKVGHWKYPIVLVLICNPLFFSSDEKQTKATICHNPVGTAPISQKWR